MKMHNPVQPGRLLREYMQDEKRMAFAARLGLNEEGLADLLDEKQSITPAIAELLSKGLTNTSPEFWMRMQVQRDEWVAEQR